jgi:ankyrin repeat protein
LIFKYADPTALDKDGDEPLHIACVYGYTKVVKCLLMKTFTNLKGSNGASPLHTACCSGYIEIADMLILSGCDIDVKDKDGFTPLHYASVKGSTPIVKRLLQKGARIEESSDRTFLNSCPFL